MSRFFKKKNEKSTNGNNNIHKYIGVTTEQIVQTKPPSKLQKLIQKNINVEIKKLSKNTDLNLMRRDVQTKKKIIATYTNWWAGMEGIGEKMSIIYSEFDRLLEAIDKKIKDTKSRTS